MPTLSNLTAKRATLVSQLEQFIGQINRINGAIAVLDELLAEDAAEQEAWQEVPHWGIHEGEAAAPDAPSVVPEMLPPAPHQMQPFSAPDEDAA